jgi:L-2-hydroxyglutarate oxidase LhgO
MDRADIVIVGAGVVGLAIARKLAASGREVVILEAEDHFGAHTSSRNSEVIHAGLYYPTGSWKARLCVAGRQLLYAYCIDHAIAHRRCGKVIVASHASQRGALEALTRQGADNGVQDLRLMSGAAVTALEPALRADCGLFSPSTGIVDSHGLMLSLLGEATRDGAVIAYRTRVADLALARERVEIQVEGDDQPCLSVALLINAAGLGAPALAEKLRRGRGPKAPQQWLARGNYFALRGRAPFRHLVYPLPEPGGLGVHLTLDLAGQARFGPDVEWIDRLDYRVDESRVGRFTDAIRRYWPDLPDGALQPDYAGIRPKLSGPGMPAADFRIDGAARHGMRPVIHLFGIESPGLTASLAIADHVADLATDILD